jgi:hypothetical protein
MGNSCLMFLLGVFESGAHHRMSGKVQIRQSRSGLLVEQTMI